MPLEIWKCNKCNVLLLRMQVKGSSEEQGMQIEHQLYSAVSATSSWLDDVENTLFSRSMLLTENAETQLSSHEVSEFPFAVPEMLSF